MTLAIDANSNGNNLSSLSTFLMSIQPTLPGEILLIDTCMSGSGKSVLSITDSLGLTWARLLRINSAGPSNELWWAFCPSTNNDSITVNMSATVANLAVDLVGVSGANAVTPFDANSLATVSASGSASTPTVNQTTSNANDILLAWCGIGANVTETAGGAFTLIDANAAGSVSNASQYDVVSSTQAGNANVFGTSSGASHGWTIIATAIQQAAAAPTGVPAMFQNFQPMTNVLTDPIKNYGSYRASGWSPYLDVFATTSKTPPRVYSGISTVESWLQQDLENLGSRIDSSIGMATPIVPGLISNGFEYYRGNVYSSRQEAIDYRVIIYPVGFPLSLIVQPPTINSGAATGVAVTSAYNHIQYNEVLAYLQEFQKDLPRSLIIQPPLAQPLAIGPYFPGIALEYGFPAAVEGYLQEFQKALPRSLLVPPAEISIFPPTGLFLVPNSNNRAIQKTQDDSFTYYPKNLTINPPFIIAQAGIGVIEAPSMYGGEHAEIQGFLQDYQLKFPRNLTINPVNVILPNALTKIMPKFQFGSMPEILAFLELQKEQYPRPQNTEPYVSLNPVIGNTPVLITDTEVVKGGSNVFVVKGNATAYVIVI